MHKPRYDTCLLDAVEPSETQLRLIRRILKNNKLTVVQLCEMIFGTRDNWLSTTLTMVLNRHWKRMRVSYWAKLYNGITDLVHQEKLK